MKICCVCRVEKELTDFYRSRKSKDGYDYRCKACEKKIKSSPEKKEKRREYYAKRHKEMSKSPEQKEAMRRASRKYARKSRDKTRSKVIEMYGGKCARCGESDPIVLDIDHVQDDGAEHRREMGFGNLLVSDVLKKGYRPDKFQMLCKNCNWRKEFARRIASRKD